jgi:hypothetical protein
MAARRKASGEARSAGPAKGPQQYYLFQFSYTAAAWAALLRPGASRDRVAALDPIVKAFGGCFAYVTFPCEGPDPKEGKFASFGERDVVALLAFPDDERAAAFAMTVGAGGAVTSMKTVKLLSWPQAMAAMERAGGQVGSYAPPKLT